MMRPHIAGTHPDLPRGAAMPSAPLSAPLSTPPDAPIRVLSAPPDAPIRQMLALPGIRISGLRWSPPADTPSSGRCLVILHGVTGNALAWDGVARALARDGWTVDALDLPGHGQTRWTDERGTPLPDQETVGVEPYELRRVGEVMARAMRALPPVQQRRAAGANDPPVDDTAARPPVVLGHSWGAGVALVAIDAGAPAAHLVLLDPPFLTPEQGAEMAASFGAELRPGLDLEQARALVRESGADDAAVEAAAHAMVETSPLAVQAVARGGPWDPLTLMAAWRAAHADLPVDVIAGDPTAGGLIPPPVLELLRVTLGPSRVHELPGLGHSPYRQDRERFLRVLRGILD
jgi:pimeloyl-ACP methyl ester carboxylesterase